MTINVNDFKSLNSDAQMIQSAIDLARNTGDLVLIPKINARTGKSIWEIEQTIFLHDESTLILQNCYLRMADDVVCQMFANKNSSTTASSQNNSLQKHITIKGIGKAVLDGGKHNGLFEVNGIARKVSKYPEKKATDNCMLFFNNVENLVIENLTIKNQRYWGICLCPVSNSRISNIHYESSSNVPCQDGIDLLKGCHDIIIENITGCVGDNIVALLATDSDIYPKVTGDRKNGDIYNVSIRNIMGYGVGGCALIRLLNHDGFKIYNVRIDNVIETSPWSMQDAPTAQNPDLVFVSDDNGNIVQTKHLIVGEQGYRCEAAIIIGESYWYHTSKAQSGDTFGISVSNVTTHARYGIWINNALKDSSFENIRMFGNGFVSAYFGEGVMENVRFSNISYDQDCKPLKADEHIYIEWNNTRSDGFSCVYFNGSNVNNISFDGIQCASGMDSVFGGFGNGSIVCQKVNHAKIPKLASVNGITIKNIK